MNVKGVLVTKPMDARGLSVGANKKKLQERDIFPQGKESKAE